MAGLVAQAQALGPVVQSGAFAPRRASGSMPIVVIHTSSGRRSGAGSGAAQAPSTALLLAHFCLLTLLPNMQGGRAARSAVRVQAVSAPGLPPLPPPPGAAAALACRRSCPDTLHAAIENRRRP